MFSTCGESYHKIALRMHSINAFTECNSIINNNGHWRIQGGNIVIPQASIGPFLGPHISQKDEAGSR